MGGCQQNYKYVYRYIIKNISFHSDNTNTELTLDKLIIDTITLEHPNWPKTGRNGAPDPTTSFNKDMNLKLKIDPIDQIPPEKPIRDILKSDNKEIFYFQYNLVEKRIIEKFSTGTRNKIIDLERFYFPDKYNPPNTNTTVSKITDLTNQIQLNINEGIKTIDRNEYLDLSPGMFLGTNLYYYNKSEDNFAPPTVLSKIPGLNLMLINTLKTFSFDLSSLGFFSAQIVDNILQVEVKLERTDGNFEKRFVNVYYYKDIDENGTIPDNIKRDLFINDFYEVKKTVEVRKYRSTILFSFEQGLKFTKADVYQTIFESRPPTFKVGDYVYFPIKRRSNGKIKY